VARSSSVVVGVGSSFGLVAGKIAANSGHECGVDSRTLPTLPNHLMGVLQVGP
jgi:hypothetical protein